MKSLIVSYVNLTVSSNVDISQIHEGYKSKYPDVLLRALGKVRGLLVRKEKKVYLLTVKILENRWL